MGCPARTLGVEQTVSGDVLLRSDPSVVEARRMKNSAEEEYPAHGKTGEEEEE